MPPLNWRGTAIFAMLKPMDAAGRKALAPEFDWEGMLKTAGYDGFPTVYMTQSTALTALASISARTLSMLGG